MKKNLFSTLMIAAVALFTACDPTGDVTITDIKLDKETATLAIDSTLTLTATVTPENADVTVTWESSKPEVATVKDGVVTGIAEGTAIIVATAEGKTASCVVSVSEGTTGGNGDNAAVLNGSEYYPIILDGPTFESLGDKVKYDFRPDSTVGKHLYYWENTYNAGIATGLNFFGNTEGYAAMTVASIGWSGAGFFMGPDHVSKVDELCAAIKANPDDYYMHIAMKSTDNAAHVFILFDFVKFTIGAAPFNDNGIMIPAVKNFDRDGEFHGMEIPLSSFDFNGYATDVKGKNLVSVLSGGVTGTQLNLDAVFIYKK